MDRFCSRICDPRWIFRSGCSLLEIGSLLRNIIVKYIVLSLIVHFLVKVVLYDIVCLVFVVLRVLQDKLEMFKVHWRYR